jgi:hypothetical protein
MKKIYLLLIISGIIISGTISNASDHIALNDDYTEGYVQSIFVNSYGLPKEAVEVKKGFIIIDYEKVEGSNPDHLFEKVTEISRDLKTVKGVRWKKKPIDLSSKGWTQTPSNSKKIDYSASANKDNADRQYEDVAMPNHSLFQPLIADPKWPRFTLAYQYYLKDGAIRRAFAPNFGASFPLYKIVSKVTNNEWEVGVQGGLFGLMDIGTKPSSLVNADYYISVPVTYSAGSWSGLIRVYHLSSHLGDEFMLTPEGKKTERINLSYEGVDFLLSYNFNNLRLYGGGGYLINRDPSYIKPLKLQGGMEYYAPYTFMNGRLRPVMGIDIKAEEYSSWYPGISCKAGVQLENSILISNKVQLMLEYYAGKSIHGQFYNDKVKYISLGLQAFL